MAYHISHNLRDQDSPKINPKELEEVDVLEEKEHQIILYNDDVNTFEHVIDCLVKICEHHYLQAEQCALLTHYKGNCELLVGEYQDLELIKEDLYLYGLETQIV